MGLQKYRADKSGEPEKNGSVPWYTNWMGGPTLALVKNCPVKLTMYEEEVAVWEESASPRTVYILGEPDTFFSLPAAIKFKGKRVNGWIGHNDDGYFFRGRLSLRKEQ